MSDFEFWKEDELNISENDIDWIYFYRELYSKISNLQKNRERREEYLNIINAFLSIKYREPSFFLLSEYKPESIMYLFNKESQSYSERHNIASFLAALYNCKISVPDWWGYIPTDEKFYNLDNSYTKENATNYIREVDKANKKILKEFLEKCVYLLQKESCDDFDNTTYILNPCELSGRDDNFTGVIYYKPYENIHKDISALNKPFKIELINPNEARDEATGEIDFDAVRFEMDCQGNPLFDESVVEYTAPSMVDHRHIKALVKLIPCDYKGA
ncbi:MAG: hypothetical protein MJ108_08995 [Saccharofermentans sp.]|nr:hypothetical protein [Saccharofermentans sp.]